MSPGIGHNPAEIDYKDAENGGFEGLQPESPIAQKYQESVV